MNRFILAAGFLLSALMFSALIPALGLTSVYACSCAAQDAARLVQVADVIVTGTVDSVSVPPPGPGGAISSMDPASVSVTVARYLKGSGGAGLQFTTARSGASCGTLEVLNVGERHVLFLKGDDSGYTTNLCSGNSPLGGVTLSGMAGQAYLKEIEAITGEGTAAEVEANASNQQGLRAPWGLLIPGLSAVVSATTAFALAIRRRHPLRRRQG